jgi:hypothetical protein
MLLSLVLASAVLPAAIEPATFKKSGVAIAAVPTIINFRLDKSFEFMFPSLNIDIDLAFHHLINFIRP